MRKTQSNLRTSQPRTKCAAGVGEGTIRIPKCFGHTIVSQKYPPPILHTILSQKWGRGIYSTIQLDLFKHSHGERLLEHHNSKLAQPITVSESVVSSVAFACSLANKTMRCSCFPLEM